MDKRRVNPHLLTPQTAFTIDPELLDARGQRNGRP